MTASLLHPEADLAPVAAPISTTHDRGVCRIQFEQRVLDQVHIPLIRDELADVIEHTDQADIVLDLEHLEYVPSTVLGVIVAGQTKMLQKGGRLLIANTSPYLRNLFGITKLERIFEMYPTAEDAILASNARAAVRCTPAARRTW